MWEIGSQIFNVFLNVFGILLNIHAFGNLVNWNVGVQENLPETYEAVL